MSHNGQQVSCLSTAGVAHELDRIARSVQTIHEGLRFDQGHRGPVLGLQFAERIGAEIQMSKRQPGACRGQGAVIGTADFSGSGRYV